MVAGIGGVLLLISLFLSWYGIDVGGSFGASISSSGSGWEWLGGGDLFLALVALAAIAPAAFDIAGMEIELPVPMSTITLAGGALGVLFVVYRIIDKPGPDVSFGTTIGVDVGLKIGIFLALASAIAICVGSFLQLGEEDSGGGSAATSGGAMPGTGMPGSVPPQQPPAAPPQAPPQAPPPPQQPPQAPPPPA